jgi:hypothetical protein
MNEFDIQTAKGTLEIAKNVAEDIVRPSSKSIGNNLGLMVDGVMGWLGCWGEKQKLKQKNYIEDFKQELNSKILKISEENLKEPSMNITGPAIESSKFFYEEKHYRDLFSNLVAASCDRSKINMIHPSYIEIIKQLSPLDAKLLSMFNFYKTYPLADLQFIDQGKKITPCQQYLFNFKDKNEEFDMIEQSLLTASLDNLIRLGVVIKNREVIELNYNYEYFKEHFVYKAFSVLKENETSEIRIIRSRIELTDFGRNFISICYS